MSRVSELLRVGRDVNLAEIDPASTPGLPDGKTVRRDPKTWARAALTELGQQLATQQEMLFANAKVNPRESDDCC